MPVSAGKAHRRDLPDLGRRSVAATGQSNRYSSAVAQDTANSTFDLLAHVFRDEPDIILVYAYGSMVNGKPSAESDVDVAVLGRQRLSTERQLRLIRDIAGRVGRPVDLVDLRTVGMPLLRIVLTEGTVVLCRDRRARGELISRMLADVEDFLPLRNRMLRIRLDRWIG